MKFHHVKYYEDLEDVVFLSDSVGFIGKSIDQRGREAITILQHTLNTTYECSWDKTELLFCIDGLGEFRPGTDLTAELDKLNSSTITIEATTLGFVEILYLVDSANQSSSVKEIQFLYVEPKKYNELRTVDNPLPHNFTLSKSLGRLIPLPGYTRNFSRRKLKTHLVVFLGFEPSRLGRVLEDDEGADISCYSLSIGLPAFVPGWEIHTLETNSDYLNTQNRQDIYYFSANSPYSAYRQIITVADSLDHDERLVLAPFGTKPAGIGVIAYAVKNKRDCGVIYDHPVRQEDRSVGVGRSHLYSCFIEK